MNSVEELRNKVKTQSNGYYANVICKNCGNFLAHPDGDYRTAIVVEFCPECCPCCADWRKAYDSKAG